MCEYIAFVSETWCDGMLALVMLKVWADKGGAEDEEGIKAGIPSVQSGDWFQEGTNTNRVF